MAPAEDWPFPLKLTGVTHASCPLDLILRTSPYGVCPVQAVCPLSWTVDPVGARVRRAPPSEVVWRDPRVAPPIEALTETLPSGWANRNCGALPLPSLNQVPVALSVGLAWGALLAALAQRDVPFASRDTRKPLFAPLRSSAWFPARKSEEREEDEEHHGIQTV